MLRVRQARGKEIAGPPRRTPRHRSDAASAGPADLAARRQRRRDHVDPAGAAARWPSARRVLLTTGTVTSARLLDQRLDAGSGAPACCTASCRSTCRPGSTRFLDHWRPDVAGFVESELWPNLLAACRARAHSDDADQRPAVRAQPGALAPRAAVWRGRCSAASPASSRAARRTPQRLRALGCRRLAEPGDLKLAAPPLPVDAGGIAAVARRAGRAAGVARRQHPSGRGRRWSSPRTELLASDHPGLLTIIAPASSRARRWRSPNGSCRSRGDRRHRPKACGSPIRWANSVCWYRLAPIVLRRPQPDRRRVAGRTRWSRRVLAAPSRSGPHTGNFADHVAMLRAAGALTVVRDVEHWRTGSTHCCAIRPRRGDRRCRAAPRLQRHADLPRAHRRRPARICSRPGKAGMRRAAPFWRHDGWRVPRLLSPELWPLVAAAHARAAWRRPGWRAPVPVICCGNVTVGGAGKTTLALDLGQRLIARGRAVHFLLRGYGGSIRGAHRVMPDEHRRRGGRRGAAAGRRWRPPGSAPTAPPAPAPQSPPAPRSW